MTVKELIIHLSNIPQHLQVELDVTPKNAENAIFEPLTDIVYDTQTVTLGGVI